MSETPKEELRVLEGHGLKLTRADGSLMLEVCESDAHTARLRLFDSDGGVRVELDSGGNDWAEDGPTVRMIDKAGAVRVWVGLSDVGRPVLELTELAKEGDDDAVVSTARLSAPTKPGEEVLQVVFDQNK